MDNQEIHTEKEKLNPVTMPELDSATANKLLDGVFAACDATPSALPVEMLETWGNYRRTEFRIGRIISYVLLVVLILLPLMFFKPTIVAKRVSVDASNNATYEIQIKTLLPVDGVTATLDDKAVALERTDSKHYRLAVTDNGVLKVQAYSINGQSITRSYDVSHLDKEKPQLVKSYTQDGSVYIVVRDTYSGIDYENIKGVDTDGNEVKPDSTDEKTSTIVFKMPARAITVTISDKAGNELAILLSPDEQPAAPAAEDASQQPAEEAAE